jgi:uncharacterized protein YutE (UPF0331/DUF86 family)
MVAPRAMIVESVGVVLEQMVESVANPVHWKSKVNPAAVKYMSAVNVTSMADISKTV